jgi:hypothetical protein
MGVKGYPKIHYDVGSVDVEINHSHMNKLLILKMTMENWKYGNPRHPTSAYRLYDADFKAVEDFINGARNWRARWAHEGGQDDFLTKDQKEYLNHLFKTYGGVRKIEKI